MNLQLAQIDLGELGSLHTYDMSGQAGELLHEFAPLHDNANRVAIFIAEGVHLIETLSLEGGDEHFRLNRNRYRHHEYMDSTGEKTFVSVLPVPLSEAGGVARVRFFGGRAVGVHVLMINPAALGGRVLGPLFAKFKDKCWLCMRLVRALCSAAIGGLDIDAEDIEDLLRVWFPDLPDEPDSELGKLLRRILDFLRNHDPRRVVARKVCEEMGYCVPPSGAQTGAS